MKILATFVLYHPDFSVLSKSLHGIAPYVDHILLWRNSIEAPASLSSLPHFDKIELAGSGDNVGISVALNHAWRYASKNGYDFLLTMDQDSIFVGFDNYLSNITNSSEPVGIYGPGANWMAFQGSLRKYDFPITSGMLVPINILTKLGGYRESFFVDGIDLDLTLRAKDLNIPVYLVGDCALLQQYGFSKSRRIFLKTISIDSYSPSRLYEMYKNTQILLCEHPSPEWKRHYKEHWGIREMIKRILVEDDKIATLRAIRKGIRDGRRWRPE